jgi:hypothetical protein
MHAQVQEILDRQDGTGSEVDVLVETVRVSGHPDKLRAELLAALAHDRKLKSLMTTHKGSLKKLLLLYFDGNYQHTTLFLAIGVYAGVWEMQSAQEILKQTREKAVEMAGHGFLYVKMLPTIGSQ